MLITPYWEIRIKQTESFKIYHLAKFPLWESTSPVFVVICQTNSATTKSYIKYGPRPPFQISFLLDIEQTLALCKVNWELGVQN